MTSAKICMWIKKQEVQWLSLGHSNTNREELRESGEPGNRRKIKCSVGENSVSGRRK